MIVLNVGGCPDSLCDCELNSDGEAMEASFPAGGRVCYTITVKDRHAHILVELNTTSEIALQALLLTASDDGSRYAAHVVV